MLQRFLSCVHVANPRGTKIYIYIFILYSQLLYVHILGLQSKWAENEDVSTRNNLSKMEVETFPLHSGPFASNKQPFETFRFLLQIPENTFKYSVFCLKKEEERERCILKVLPL